MSKHHLEVARCNTCRDGVFQIICDHTGRESGLGHVHDSADCQASCTDNLSLEGNVKLADFGVAGHGCVFGALKGFDGVIGQLASSGIVTGNGTCGGDVVGDRADLLVGRGCTRGHHIIHVGDGIPVEVSLGA